MRKLIYYIASTIDGFIARKDGSFDFFLAEGKHFDYLLSEFPETIPHHLRDELGVHGDNKHFDTVIMGRKTYEVGSNVGITNPYPQMRQVLISSSLSVSPDQEVELVTKNPISKIQNLKQSEGLDIWLCGGAKLATTLYSEIDELILKINPIILGDGTPLFDSAVEPMQLKMIDTKVFDNGFMINHYQKQ